MKPSTFCFKAAGTSAVLLVGLAVPSIVYSVFIKQSETLHIWPFVIPLGFACFVFVVAGWLFEIWGR